MSRRRVAAGKHDKMACRDILARGLYRTFPAIAQIILRGQSLVDHKGVFSSEAASR
jgi:hypothetical protein